MYKSLPLEPGEMVVLRCHKHWLVYAVDGLILLVMLVAPNLAYTWGARTMGQAFVINHDLAVFLYFGWFSLLWVYFFIVWTNTYLDAWIITDKRIIDIEQKSLFHREVSDFRIEKIQNITVKEAGFMANVFGYGAIHVETAGERIELKFDYLPKPYNVRDTISECHDKCIARLENSGVSPITQELITDHL